MFRRRYKRNYRSRRTGRKRSFRRYTRSTRSRQIIRRSLRRRPVIPEVKFIDLVQTTTPVPGVTTGTGALSPTQLNQGPGVSNRIGESIKCRKLFVHYQIQGPLTNTVTNAQPDGYVRIILWTPRIDYSNAASYINTLSFRDILDFNVLTIHKDIYLHLGCSYSATYASGSANTTSVPTGSPIATLKHLTWTIPFPRNAKFPPAILTSVQNQFDIDKDVMYITHMNNFAFPINFSYTTRLTYVDA
jgi:hypothetical protein